MKNRWVIEKENPKLRDRMAKSLGLCPITAQILINRGIKTEAEAESFLNAGLFDIPSPNLIKGMDAAVGRIRQALERAEKVAIYGDYDVDGVTATALFYIFLKNLGADISYYNPDRLKEGYGINSDAISKLKEAGVSLVVSGDCGITAAAEVEEAKRIGVDFIITDHHETPPTIPAAVSVLNPHQPGCPYPGKEITGVGVIFNLVIALRRSLRESGFFKSRPEPNLGDYLDLVALGTVSDCASLTNVNRIFVKEGIKRMQSPKRPGTAALKEASGIRGVVGSFDIGFKLGPRINASGRLMSADVAVRLLISDDIAMAREYASALSRENSKRQAMEREILADAIAQIESNPNFLASSSLALASDSWHAGVIGIVASRLVERYEKPVVLIAVGEDGAGKGSGRSVPGVNIYEALRACEDLFDRFGGHELAAGMSIQKGKIDEMRARFERAVSLAAGRYVSTLRIDALCDMEHIDEALVSDLDRLAPFGIGNPEPTLLAKFAEVISCRTLKGGHLKIKFRRGDGELEGVWFNAAENLTLPSRMDVVFTPEFNSWNGNREVRVRIRDADWGG
ncbi:MAG: single-stranded-DNA-specific exonuclease RecJ [Deltaproteobacteria bacterium]